MRKIFFKLNSLILAIFLISSNFVYATSSGNIVSSYVVNKNLTSLDLSFVSDVLRLNLKKIPDFLKSEILNLQNYEKNNIDLVKNGNYNSNLLIGGSSGGGGVTRMFYNNEFQEINEFKDLVKNYNVRKSLNSNNLTKFIDKGLIYDNEKFNKIFSKWNNKILNYYNINDNLNLNNFKSFKLKDLKLWYLKTDAEEWYFHQNEEKYKLAKKYNFAVGLEFPKDYFDMAFTNRMCFRLGIVDPLDFDQWYFPTKLNEDWEVRGAWQLPKNYRFTDEYMDKNHRIQSDPFLMYGTNRMNDPDLYLSLNIVTMGHSSKEKHCAYQVIKYHKFLVKLPNGKFKISYIVDFAGNMNDDLNYPDGVSNFDKDFPVLLNLKADELYNYFTRYDHYDFDLTDNENKDININDIFIPYNANNVDNKQILDKLNNIDDFLYYLLSNLDYNKQFNNLNKRLDNYDGLFLNFDNKLNYIIDKLNNHKLFDYNKLNEIIKNNLEEFNKKYIEGLSEDLKYITNLVKENKIEILKNNDKIVEIYDKVNEIDNNIDSINTRFNKYDEDLEYIKKNLKSDGQNEKDNNFKNQFNDPEKNRVADSLNFFDKFIGFFKDFFTVTEEFDFKKIDTSKIYKKIPFSIFYDLKSIIKKLTVPPKVPKFDIPIYTETIVVDFEKFESLAVIVRSFILLYVVIFLVMKIYSKVG